jgi:hypothetical protein
MAAGSGWERRSGRRKKNFRTSSKSIVCTSSSPTGWCHCHHDTTSASCRAEPRSVGALDRTPLPVGSLASEKSTIYTVLFLRGQAPSAWLDSTLHSSSTRRDGTAGTLSLRCWIDSVRPTDRRYREGGVCFIRMIAPSATETEPHTRTCTCIPPDKKKMDSNHLFSYALLGF